MQIDFTAPMYLLYEGLQTSTGLAPITPFYFFT